MQHSSTATKFSQPADRTMMLGGLVVLACYTIHATFHLAHGRWYDLLWACHIAAIFIGAGLLARSATLNGVGVLLGLMGLPLWVLDLAAGSDFLPTSLLTHVVALAIGLYAVARLGMPCGTWWKTTATLVGLIGLCRIATPSEANVNVAFNIQHGWEEHFASHASYLASTTGCAAVYFLFIASFVRRLSRPARGDNNNPDLH